MKRLKPCKLQQRCIAAVQEARRRLSGAGMAEGGRVELQEGGPTTYQSIVDDILATYPEGDVQEIQDHHRK